jgi:outer membrane protein TolC
MRRKVSRNRGRRLATVVVSAALAGCVAYEAEDVTLQKSAAALPRHVGALTFAQAVALAIAHNGEIQAREAECRAAGLDVMPTELQAQLQQESLALMIDPFALLGLTQRGASSFLAESRAAEAAAALAQTRWRVVAGIAEVFAHHRALDGLQQVPLVAVDSEVFAAAGLASPVAIDQVRAAAAAADAERHAIDTEKATQIAELRQMLGLSPASELDLVLPAADWPHVPPADEESLLRRPDLALALARYRTADAEFRKSVADQYPSLMIGPDVPLRGGTIDPMAILRLPLGAAGPAEAARERRNAARSRLNDALALAANEAASTVAQYEAAAARERAASSSARASARAFVASTAALHVEVDAFERVSEKAPVAVRDAMEAREAAIASARARVRSAVAAGWPAAEARR